MERVTGLQSGNNCEFKKHYYFNVIEYYKNEVTIQSRLHIVR